ncbi:hypothetical protein RclHR1_17250004 [Rhizophagus clarus]|uniref:Endonuclease/exonuclease/phosphatase domain-containing protein n=1 Tax=Rhizophagus clarus TaxID=94130 RepID=A0A2Z6R050_9GLOM|nr:hypothetical protein RclHR1_17250004 [Rhizophagus clarus]
MGSNNTAHKLDDLMTLMQDDDIDIVVVTKTNSDRKKSSFLDITRYNNRYKFYFCDKDISTNKSIGYGVAIAKREIHITAIYAAPKNKQHIHKKLIDNTIKQLQQNQLGSTRTLHIIAGNFNEIVDPELDKSTPSSKKPTTINQCQNVLHQLQTLGFKDTFRLINNDQKAFTYKHSKSEDEASTYTRIDMLWMKAPKQIIVKTAYIIPSVGCTDSDHDILITKLYTAEFLVNNRRHTRRAALDQPGVAATTRMDKEQFGNTNTPRKESDAADISSVKRQIIDLDKTFRSNIELFQQACRDFANSPSIQLHLNDTYQAIEQLVYTNSEPWADHKDDTDAAAGPCEAVKKSINSFWSQIANGINKAINSHLLQG